MAERTTTGLGLVLERQSIERVAIVDIGDGGGVELQQRRRRVEYTPDEAIELGQKLIDLGMQTQLDVVSDQNERESEAWQVAGEVLPTATRPAHGFDVAPVCRDCSEGKHGACIGTAFVEVSDDIAPEEVDCGCSKAAHNVVSGDRPWLRAKVGEVWILDWRVTPNADFAHCGARAVKVESGHFDLLDGFGYVAPSQITRGRRIEATS